MYFEPLFAFAALLYDEFVLVILANDQFCGYILAPTDVNPSNPSVQGKLVIGDAVVAVIELVLLLTL